MRLARWATGAALVLLALSWLTVVQPFVYGYNGHPSYTTFGMFGTPIYLLEYSLQVLNVACFFWILHRAYRHVVYPKLTLSF